MSKLAKIQTSIYVQPGNPGFTCMFKVTWYQNQATLFTENIRPRPCIGETREIAKMLLLDGIKTWISTYDLDWKDFDIRDKDILKWFEDGEIELLPF